jgi:hypothetical protein
VAVSPEVKVPFFVAVLAVLVTGATFFAAGFCSDGATAASSAQAGTTRIKANKQSSILFMFISL